MVKSKVQAIDVGEPEKGEDCATRKTPHVSTEKKFGLEGEVVDLLLMASESLAVGTGDNQLQSVDVAKGQSLKGDEDEPIRRSKRVAELSKKFNTNYLVVYGLVDKAKVKALNAFVKEK